MSLHATTTRKVYFSNVRIRFLTLPSFARNEKQNKLDHSDLPLQHRPTRTGPDLDPYSTRFRPDSDLKRVISGPNQVEIKSKSGPKQVRAEGFSWVGAGGVGPGGRIPVAPRKVSKISLTEVDKNFDCAVSYWELAHVGVGWCCNFTAATVGCTVGFGGTPP